MYAKIKPSKYKFDISVHEFVEQTEGGVRSAEEVISEHEIIYPEHKKRTVFGTNPIYQFWSSEYLDSISKPIRKMVKNEKE